MFRGMDPYGTSGGSDSLATLQTPVDARLAVGQTYITYLIVNGPLTIRDRASIEQVIRTLNAQGGSNVTIIYRDDGAIIDANVSDVTADAGIRVQSISPGVIRIDIPPLGITSAMLADALITASKVADGSITTAKVADANITLAKLAPGSVDSSKIVDGAITAIDLANGAVTSAKIGPSTIVDANIASKTISPGTLQDAVFPTLLNSVSNATTTSAVAFTANSIVFTPPYAGCSYRWEIIAGMNAEGSGTIGNGSLQITGTSNGPSINATYEQGVNTTHLTFSQGGVGNSPGNAVTFAFVWTPTSGSITRYSSWMSLKIWQTA